MTRYSGRSLGIGTTGLAISLLLGLGLATDALGDHVASSESMGPIHGARLVIPLMNPNRGREIFVNKGCVACHFATSSAVAGAASLASPAGYCLTGRS